MNSRSVRLWLVLAQGGVTHEQWVYTNLSTTNWVAIATNTAPFTITDTAFTNNTQRFYRAIYKP